MKNWLNGVVILFIAIAASNLFVNDVEAADGRNFGAGIMIGDPTGLSFKYVQDAKMAYDLGLAWSNHIDIHLHGDVLWQKPQLFRLDNVAIDGYFGLGARLRDFNDDRYHNHHDEDLQLGLRVPGGLRYLFNQPRIELFGEIAVIMDVIPDTSADFDLALGTRYYF